MNPRPVWLVTLLAAAMASSLGAQEQSVKPGINKSFEDPNVDRFVGIFEGESREVFRYRHAIVGLLGLEPDSHVADIGAGTGLFTRLIAAELGDEGRVYAVDIAQKFLDHIESTVDEQYRSRIVPVLCDQRTTNLAPESVDLVFVCDTYHHFEYPAETLASVRRALRPDGVLVIVDFERIAGVSSAFVLGHVRCGKGTVTDEVKDAGFELLDEVPLMKEQYVLRFGKRVAASNDAQGSEQPAAESDSGRTTTAGAGR